MFMKMHRRLIKSVLNVSIDKLTDFILSLKPDTLVPDDCNHFKDLLRAYRHFWQPYKTIYLISIVLGFKHNKIGRCS